MTTKNTTNQANRFDYMQERFSMRSEQTKPVPPSSRLIPEWQESAPGGETTNKTSEGQRESQGFGFELPEIMLIIGIIMIATFVFICFGQTASTSKTHQQQAQAMGQQLQTIGTQMVDLGAGMANDTAGKLKPMTTSRTGTNLNSNDQAKEATIHKARTSTWTLSPKLTLKQNLEEWTKRAGWTLHWKATDYQVSKQVKLTGTFNGRHGAMAQLIKKYRQAGVSLNARAYPKNKVLVITNKINQP